MVSLIANALELCESLLCHIFVCDYVYTVEEVRQDSLAFRHCWCRGSGVVME